MPAASSANRWAVVHKPGQFCHEEASAISRWALGRESAGTVVVDLSHATDATTAAFATLVVLRRQLLREGRDLRVSGLRERAQYVYAISRLTNVLPQECEGTDADAPCNPAL